MRLHVHAIVIPANAGFSTAEWLVIQFFLPHSVKLDGQLRCLKPGLISYAVERRQDAIGIFA